jgi:Kef-type K+ transport system membrane component KefB
VNATVAITPPRRFGVWLLIYLSLLTSSVGLYFLVRDLGSNLEAPVVDGAKPIGRVSAGSVDVVQHVTLTLTVVIALGFTLGRLVGYLGQPPVIGEILAGILLGPSLLGTISPEAMHSLIPSKSDDPGGQVSAALKAVAQLGVIFYMFLIGLELNAPSIGNRLLTVVTISHTGILVQFTLGVLLALALYPIYSHSAVPFGSFALFLGVAMAVTAFPVLARILSDRGMAKTELGMLALSCAAIDDLTAWCLLALVIGVAQTQVAGALSVTVLAIGFVVFMLMIARPLLARVSHRLDHTDGPLPGAVVPLVFLGVLASAVTTELMGIHAIFGAFLIGAILPHEGRIAREFTQKLKDPVTVLFLPAFFAYTGMRTEIGLIQSAQDWLFAGVVILVATLGKFGGATLAARLTGHSWRDSASLGILMNTRGLMELIVLNIGLDLGVISPRLYTILVLMALVTTAMTSPLLARIRKSGID